MQLSPEESLFIARRSWLSNNWPLVGKTLLVLVLTLTAWLWTSTPHLVNPWAVAADLQSGALPDASIPLMAALLPMMTLTLLLFIALAIGLAFSAFANERRLIRIINQRLSLKDPIHEEQPPEEK
ncbi:hypothetical protein [Oceanisphaera arctica]|uniref:Uncharacterized protein n=1 Tax=Oceanisphaera arctica TaxID=641510 RepID=A0A2P5TIS6_9GAMM|nr:hypothetical protein [Oceanisphaera arctica]PPL14747.1 hypothetical protein UN63_14800 [Oceanisphaera arctica]GHA15101.1 hypothetical protein GCM10007082_14850 [Oceanisphaera arctica]